MGHHILNDCFDKCLFSNYKDIVHPLLLEGNLRASEWPTMMHYDVTFYCSLLKPPDKTFSLQHCTVSTSGSDSRLLFCGTPTAGHRDVFTSTTWPDSNFWVDVVAFQMMNPTNMFHKAVERLTALSALFYKYSLFLRLAFRVSAMFQGQIVSLSRTETSNWLRCVSRWVTTAKL